MTSINCPRSYLKWAGSKRKLVSTIAELIPSEFKAGRLIEPFVGSGAVALGLGFKSMLLADANNDLIHVHKSVAADPDAFLAKLTPLFTIGTNTAGEYLRLRAEFNAETNPARRAELFVYLNRHGFNGLMRYSGTGKFNTPFGSIAKPYMPHAEAHEFSRLLKTAEFVAADFQEIMLNAEPGDVIYCDPPYLPLTPTANFTAYTAGSFGLMQHEKLALAAKLAAKRGALVIISNHDTAQARDLYADADKIIELSVLRTISSQGTSRAKVPELMALFY
ncbi:MAG: Dam family site-specific DNA-(adenine-N6)-methyltransferase [Rhodocyclaceae bacterium]|nr:Dam family site-specific DNA-(adenine-N6)-methyltransferase [Rhodocyclaceae bacterium]